MTATESSPRVSRVFPRFEGKWVMVTGAGTGFGATLSKRAAAEGANVVVHYNSSEAGANSAVRRSSCAPTSNRGTRFAR
jgi:NAD(P)-dependent dehydrogenase (short-subunit alcohol dehydrogenase family)